MNPAALTDIMARFARLVAENGQNLDGASAERAVRDALGQGPVNHAPAHTAEEPGYCYLALFRESAHTLLIDALGVMPTRAAVERAAEEFSTDLHTGFLSVTFGSPASVQKSQKLLLHVKRVRDGESFMKVKDVLDIVPRGARYGDDSDGERPAAGPTPDLPAPVPALLGSVPDPTLRRFYYKADSITPGTPVTNFFTKAVNPAGGSNIADFLSFTSFACYQSLTVHFIPMTVIGSPSCNLQVAWYASNENAPASEAAFNKAPTHEVHFLGPAAPNGRPNSVAVPCPIAYGIQRVLKPAPHFGGVPNLAVRYKLESNDAATLVASTAYYGIYIEAVISTRPI